MKIKIKQTFRSMWATILAVLMLLSTFSAVAVTLNKEATGDTLTGGQIIYLNGGGSSLWNKDNAWFAAYFFQGSDPKWVEMEQQTGDYYYATVPSGNWSKVIFVRMKPDSHKLDWSNKLNQTGNLDLNSSNNLFTMSDWSNGAWGKYQPSTSATLTPSSTTVATGDSVTLTPGISDTTYNAYKSVSYSINPSTGASITDNTFTATTAGEYTVTATVTYNAIGYTGITKTAQASTTITVNSSSTPTTDYYVYGDISVSKWDKGDTTNHIKIDKPYKGEVGKRYAEITSVESGKYFAITDGTKQIGPDSNGAKLNFDSFTSTVTGSNKTWKTESNYRPLYVIIDTTVQGTPSVKFATSLSSTYNVQTSVKLSDNGSTYTEDSDSAKAPTGGGNITGTTNLVAKDISGYTFAGWEVTAGATISSTNMSVSYTPTADTTVYALYNKNYTVTIGTHTNGAITVDDAESNKTVPAGTQVTIVATPNPGYAFSAWTGDLSGVSNATVTKTVTSDITANATFEEVTYTVTAKSEITGGAVYIGANGQTSQTTNYNGEVTVIAVPAENYIFKGWKSATGATFADSTRATTTATITSNVIIEAEFISQNSDYLLIGNHTDFGEWKTSKAPPLYNTSTDNVVQRSFQLNKDVTYLFNIYKKINDSTGTWIKPAKTTEIKDITSGDVWTGKINDTSTGERNFNITPSSNGIYTFTYNTSTGDLKITKTLLQHTITVDTTTTNGTVSVVGDTTVNTGATVTLSNSPDPGYELDSYNVYKTGDSATTVPVTGNIFKMPDYNVTVSATFKKINYSMNCAAVPSSNTNSVICQNSLGQTITTAQKDDTVKFIAQEVSGYTFKEWSIDGADVTGLNLTSDVIEVTVGTSEITATATYEANYYTVTSNPVTVVEGSFTVEVLNAENKAQFGSTVTVNPNPADGYELDKITVRKDVGGTPSIVDPTNNSFTMPDGAVTITVTFKKVVYTMTGAVADGSPKGAGVTPNPAQASIGNQVTFTVANVTGYKVSNIEVEGTGATYDISADNKTVTVTVGSSDVTVTATYAPEVYNITQTVSGNGSINVPARAAYKSTVTIQTTPQTGYVILEGGVTVTITSGTSAGSTVNAPKDENGNYTFTMPAGDVQVDVRFEKAAYNINKPSESNYTVTIDGNKTTAGYGETVAFTIEPVRSFDTIESVTVTDALSNEVELTQVDGKYTFVMPNSDVTINATHSTTSSGYSIVGSFNSWDTGKNVLIKKNASTTSNYVYTTVELTAGTYEFQVSHSGGWISNAGTMKRDQCTDWDVGLKTGNCKLNADVDGIYTFVLDTSSSSSTKKLSVIYPKTTYYVVGRFKTATYETPSWVTDDKNMPFKYDSATGNYKLETGQTIATLSGSAKYFFWVYDGTNHFKNSDGDYESFQDCSSETNKRQLKIIDVKTDGSLRFNNADSDNQVPVTLWFDPVERTIWYTAQSSYSITANSTDDATITTDKSEAAPNDTVTVTVTPTDSNNICKSVTVTDTNGNNPISATKNANGTWSFTMPSYDVKVSATVGVPVYYNVTFGSNDSSKGTVTASNSVGPIQNGSTILEGTQVTFVANVVNGNSFQGWYSDSACTQPLADSSSRTYTTTINSITTVYAKFTEVTDELFSSATKTGAYYLIYSDTYYDCPKFTSVGDVYIRDDGMLYAKFEGDNFDATKKYHFQVSTQQGGDGAYKYSLHDKQTNGTFDYEISVITDAEYADVVTVQSRNDYNAESLESQYHTYQNGRFEIKPDYQDAVTSVIVELGRYNSDDGSLSDQPYKVIPSYSASTSTNHAVYAKNGTLATTYEYGTTIVEGSTSTRKSSVEVENKCTKYYAQEGDALTIKTTVKDDFATQGYSVRAFVISSEDSTETVSVNIDGNTATATYLMPAKNIEITPIYKNSNFTYYPVYLYPNGVNDNWGQEIAVYSYYYYNNTHKDETDKYMNSQYPGEPMMFDGEKYVTYVPKEYMEYNAERGWTAPADYKISGVTFNNNGNDSVHSKFLSTAQQGNKQTYDFDDFVKIVDNGYDTASFIVQPKYGTTMNKETLLGTSTTLVKTPSTTYGSDKELEAAFTGTTKNGWDRLTDLSGNDISILGYQCGDKNGNGSLKTDNMLRIVSVGDQNHQSNDTNFGEAVGEWSVIWYVYDGSGKLITAAHPSQFVPIIDKDTGEAFEISRQSDAFQAVYNYTGQANCAFTAAYITYETEKSYGAAATRLDGRWLYQTSVSTVNVNAKVVYKNAEGNFVEDANGTVATATLDDTDFSTKTVNVGTEVQFNAGSAQGDYKFAGWSTTADNTGIISKTATYTSSINTDTTLYAVYVPLDSGEIKITHNIYKGEGAGNGTGNLSITATVTHNGTNKNYVGTNQVAATMSEGDTLTVKLSTTGTFGSTFVAYYKDDTKITTDPMYSTGGTSSTVTLTYQYSELITGESATRGFNSLDFYSDLKRNGIVVKFKYYDRSVVNNTPADMNSSPSTITFDKAIPDSIINETDVKKYYSKLIDYAADNTVNPSNIVDSYYYWSSQANAVAGIQTKKNYHTENGSNYSATPYHTDQYGNVRTPESPTYEDNWVSYLDSKGAYIEEDSLTATSDVKTITVWYFNTPKKYSCTMHYAKSTDTPVQIGSTGKYLGSSSKSINNLYYNVRLGTSNSKNDGNAIPNYLENYGVEAAFVGTIAETAETIGDKQFLYWAYDAEGKNIASTNRYYEYRITSSTTLYAIYGPASDVLKQPGLTVKANVPDVYDKGGVSYTRLNTTFNPYNCPDNDTNISDIGVIYMRASKSAEKKIEGLSADDFLSLRNQIATAVNDAKTTGLVKGSVKVDLTTNKYNGFKYTVKQDPSEAYDVKLTSKNRVMFTDSFQTSSLAGYTYYVFGVMVYNNYPNADGTTATTPTAICSDNYASYTFDNSGKCEDTFEVEDDKPATT